MNPIRLRSEAMPYHDRDVVWRQFEHEIILSQTRMRTSLELIQKVSPSTMRVTCREKVLALPARADPEEPREGDIAD